MSNILKFQHPMSHSPDPDRLIVFTLKDGTEKTTFAEMTHVKDTFLGYRWFDMTTKEIVDLKGAKGWLQVN